MPDTAEQRRAWHIQITQLCDAADDLLDENVEAFEQLRKLEAEAPQALERLTARRAAAQQALTTAPAARFGAEDDTGRVEIGARADLVVLDEDPARDSTALAKVNLTLRNGEVIYSASGSE